VYLDAAWEGTYEGPDVETLRRIARESGMRITAAGGIDSPQELWAMNELLGENIDSVVVGRAIFENRFPCQLMWRSIEQEIFSTGLADRRIARHAHLPSFALAPTVPSPAVHAHVVRTPSSRPKSPNHSIDAEAARMCAKMDAGPPPESLPVRLPGRRRVSTTLSVRRNPVDNAGILLWKKNILTSEIHWAIFAARYTQSSICG
ncbi:MAG: HisA/HisF-related TIM barrel protein, partial [Candidatus Kapaibacterium sp.]